MDTAIFMDTSMFFAKFFGIYLVVASIAMFMRKDELKNMLGQLADQPFMIFAAAIILMLGTFLMLSHNIWVQDWRVVVTILCWIVFIKGIMYFIAPKMIINIGYLFVSARAMGIAAAVNFLVGAFLLYQGFLT